jgi:hypothetical protein
LVIFGGEDGIEKNANIGVYFIEKNGKEGSGEDKMLESIFIILIIMAFIVFILAIDSESYPLCILSSIIWLIVGLQCLYVEVPNASDPYQEFGLAALSLAFVFAGIVLAVIYYMNFRIGEGPPT